jgi:hypothetical protein
VGDGAPVGRQRAIEILDEQRGRTLTLIAQVPQRRRTAPGLGGGTWSMKDLLGHLESWERHALDALEAWGRNEPAPIDVALRAVSLHEVNRREVERKAGRSFRSIEDSAAATHRELLDAIRAMTDERWERPATSRGRRPLGGRLAQILWGAGAFGHDAAHLRDLEGFVREPVGRR